LQPLIRAETVRDQRKLEARARDRFLRALPSLDC
jgi:hypothetical protein